MTGKGAKRNAESNRKLKEIYLEKCLTTCEIRLDGCAYNNFLSFAHRHKRNWYLSHPELLSSFNQTLLACVPCHQKIEYDKELTESIFKDRRGEEKL